MKPATLVRVELLSGNLCPSHVWMSATRKEYAARAPGRPADVVRESHFATGGST
jgi:hypothetical protein